MTRYMDKEDVKRLKELIKKECALHVRFSGKYVLILWSDKCEMRIDMIRNETTTDIYRAYLYAEDRHELFTTNGLIEYINEWF